MRRAGWALAVGVLYGAAAVSGQTARSRALSESFTNWSQHPAIHYADRDTDDPIAELQRRMAASDVHLKKDGTSGYLRSLLDALQISPESQLAVFNQDSFQARLINAGNPRALFFNDRIAVGWVRGGLIEVAAQDPTRGVIFYTLQQTLPAEPQFDRHDERCLVCHYSYSTAGAVGMLARSARQFSVTHRLPIDERWGGWYVTGDTGGARHLGNIDLPYMFDAAAAAGATKLPSLEGTFDLDGYPTPHSDVAALMVFEHQMHMMNLLTRIGWEARVAEFRQGKSAGELRRLGDDSSEQTVPLDDAAKEVVDYMLFVEEAPLPAPIHGSSAFTTHFAAAGPRDHLGRSLRQLDLQTRLLRYPCSYLIYSEQFEQLPAPAKAAVYGRLWQVLSGGDHDPAYARLTLNDRAAIVEILRDTKSDLPAYFGSLR